VIRPRRFSSGWARAKALTAALVGFVGWVLIVTQWVIGDEMGAGNRFLMLSTCVIAAAAALAVAFEVQPVNDDGEPLPPVDPARKNRKSSAVDFHERDR
jgi:hypothetical protein